MNYLKPEESALIESYRLVKHESGIIELTLDLHEKSFWSSQCNSCLYEITNDDGTLEENPLIENYPIREFIEINVDVLKDENVHYASADSRCKDQCKYYWIPIALLGMEKLQNKIHEKYNSK